MSDDADKPKKTYSPLPAAPADHPIFKSGYFVGGKVYGGRPQVPRPSPRSSAPTPERPQQQPPPAGGKVVPFRRPERTPDPAALLLKSLKRRFFESERGGREPDPKPPSGSAKE